MEKENCPACHGTGDNIQRNYSDAQRRWVVYKVTCGRCNGSGKVKKMANHYDPSEELETPKAAAEERWSRPRGVYGLDGKLSHIDYGHGMEGLDAKKHYMQLALDADMTVEEFLGIAPQLTYPPTDPAPRSPQAEPTEPAEGKKFDAAKPPIHLLPWDALDEVVKVLALGEKKYGARNWEKGMDWHRLFRAGVGHLKDWFLRKGPDEESGISHLAHAACCCLFLLAYEIRKVGKDDRPNA